jgi:hypothetical protein
LRDLLSALVQRAIADGDADEAARCAHAAAHLARAVIADRPASIIAPPDK